MTTARFVFILVSPLLECWWHATLFCWPSAKIMRTWQGKRTSVGERTTKEKCGPKPKLSRPDQFFMVLVHLRLGRVVEDLADCFYVSPSTVSRAFTTWINLMYFKFLELPMRMSRRKVDKHMPPSFRQWYPTTRVIIDATEFLLKSRHHWLARVQLGPATRTIIRLSHSLGFRRMVHSLSSVTCVRAQ